MSVLPASLQSRLRGHTELRQIARNTGWLAIDRILRAVVALAVGAWVARYLGPQQFGLYSYALAFVAVFSVVAALGLDEVVVRDVVLDPRDEDVILGTAFTLKVAAGFMAWLLAIGAVLLLEAGNTVHWLVAIASLGLVFQAFNTIDLWFRSRLQSKYTVYARSAAFLPSSAAKLTLIWVHASVIAFACVALAEAILTSLALVALYRRIGHRLDRWRGSFVRAREMLRTSWPLILASLAVVIYMRIDQVMLASLVSTRAVGVYSAAVWISELWYFIPIALVSSTFPAVLGAKKTGEPIYYDRLQRLFNLLTQVSLAVAFPMTFVSGMLVALLLGQSYAGAGPMLAVHIWAAPFVFLGVAQSSWDVTEGLTRLALVRTLIGAFINVTLNFVLIPRYAGLGAAISLLVCQAFSTFLLNAVFPRTRRIFWMQVRALLVFTQIGRRKTTEASDTVDRRGD